MLGHCNLHSKIGMDPLQAVFTGPAEYCWLSKLFSRKMSFMATANTYLCAVIKNKRNIIYKKAIVLSLVRRLLFANQRFKLKDFKVV